MARRRKNESGYALLLIFLMAAVIAISMYSEIPRVAFETQRQKELLLIERGEQYKRAIQLFFKDQKRLPLRIEELDGVNNKHFLRKKYVDPMTGKDEWRVIHATNGILSDSKVQTQNAQNQQQTGGSVSTYLGAGVAGLGQTPVNQTGQATPNPGLRRRGSDSLAGTPGASGDTGGTGPPGMPPMPRGVAGIGTMPGQPGMPGQTGMAGQPAGSTGFAGQPGQTGIPGQPIVAGQQGMQGRPIPGQPIPGQQIPGMPGATGTTGRGVVPTAGAPAAAQGGSSLLGGGGSYLGGGGSSAPVATGVPPNVMPGQPGMPGQTGMPGAGAFPPGVPVNSQTGGASPYPTTAGANGQPPGFGQPGMTTGSPQAQSAAAAMIGQILTQPRPGGMPQTNTGGVAIAGMTGIAGFASNADQDSIIVYNEQSNYGLWEFVFDPTKVKPLASATGGTPGTPASQVGSPMGQPIGQPMNSPFGGQQQQSPFGQQQTPFGGGRRE
jgi:hypothetical protein